MMNLKDQRPFRYDNLATVRHEADKDTHADPFPVIKSMFDEGDVYGKIGPCMYLIYPARQYGDEGISQIADSDDAVHALVMAIKPGQRVWPKDLEISEMAPAMDMILWGIRKYPLTQASYSLSQDPFGPLNNWLRHPMSLGSWHAHIFKHRVNIPYIERPMQRMVEYQHQVVNSVFQTLYAQPAFWSEEMQSIAKPIKRDAKHPHVFPMGGVVFQMSAEDPASLARITIENDRSFERMHEVVYGLFSSNYPDVKAANWRIPHVLRPMEERRDTINRFAEQLQLDEDTRQGLLYISMKLKREDILDRSYMRSPSYTFALMLDNEGNLIGKHQVNMSKVGGNLEVDGGFTTRTNVELIQDANRRARCWDMVSTYAWERGIVLDTALQYNSIYDTAYQY